MLKHQGDTNMPSFFKTEKENTSKTRLIDNLKIYSYFVKVYTISFNQFS